jgi:hypothetical protein
VASAIDICNLALSRIGQGVPIASLTEASEPAVQCNALLPIMRDLVLGDADWSFARRTVALALVAEDPTPTWGYSYRAPSTCRRALYLEPEQIRIPWAQAGDDSGDLIYTDVEDAVLVYTEQVTNLGLWSTHAADALAWRMGADLALVLARDAGRAEDCRKQYQAAILRASANDGNAGRPKPSTYLSPGETRTETAGTTIPPVEV